MASSLPSSPPNPNTEHATTPPRPDHWFHSFQFPDGEEIAGVKPLDGLRSEAALIFPERLDGLSVLDIGAWDGFFSFEAERRGAADVLATDHFSWGGAGWGDKRGFDHAHHRLGSRVRSLDLDIADHNPLAQGRFDMVLLLGVLYHVTDPYGTLRCAAAMCAKHLVVETVVALRHETLPAMRLFTNLELDGDPTNYWAPNVPALREMARRFGFSRCRVLPESLDEPRRSRWTRALSRKDRYRRAIFHAWR